MYRLQYLLIESRCLHEIRCQKTKCKKSIKARTTGKVKRQGKKAVNPLYGKKGMGIMNDPKKAVYNQTTVGVNDILQSESDCSAAEDNSVSVGDIPGLIGSFFQLLFALLQVVFWFAILVGIIAFVIWIIYFERYRKRATCSSI